MQLMHTFTLVNGKTIMNKIDDEEFSMLRGTETMENFIKNRVPMVGKPFIDQPDTVYDLAEKLCNEMYYVRKLSDNQTNFYFSSPIDRSRFLDACALPEFHSWTRKRL